MPRLLAVLIAASVLAGCSGSSSSTTEADARERALVLISIDGARYDYLDRADATLPTFRRFMAEGIRAERLVPVYPTKTFPNHYSLVTGLHPEAHGIVGNTMLDPTMGDARGDTASFSLRNREAIADGRWWGGEPIWATAERQGLRAGTVFWPGSEAEIGGIRPTRWLPYNRGLEYPARVDSVLTWLDGGMRFLTLYFEIVDDMGHRHGPDAPETTRAMEQIDGLLALLIEGLDERGTLATTDLVVVSDHGMAPVTTPIFLDDTVDLDTETASVIWGESAGIWPAPGADVDALVARVDALDHVDAYRREDVPERFRHRDNERIPPIVIMPEPGWTVTSRGYVEDRGMPSGGAHGYDNALPDLHGIFLARGPSFPSGETTGALSVVDVYGIMTRVLGLTPALNDGDPEAVDRVLR
ncbi:MAG: ectonucleotide pyrophosphatase/phosphodiesterase [Bacteroidota bacterium]